MSKTKTKPKTAKKTATPSKANAVAVIKATPNNTLAVIADALKDKNFKPENMRLVLDMHKEMVAEQSRIDFINAFYLMKRELPRINKDGKIEILEKGNDGKRVAGRDKVQQSTKYATYENIREVVDPILDRFGFTMYDETEPTPDGTRLLVRTHLDHNNGHGRVSTFPLPAETSGSKNNVQGWGSSNSYGKRYGAVNLLNLRTKAPEDQDTDGRTPIAGEVKTIETGDKAAALNGEIISPGGDDGFPATISTAQVKQIEEAINFCGVPLKTFLAKYEIEKVSDLKVSMFATALRACATFAEAHAVKQK